MMVINVSADDDELDHDDVELDQDDDELDDNDDELYHHDDELHHHDDDELDVPCRHVDSLIRQSRAHSMVNL